MDPLEKLIWLSLALVLSWIILGVGMFFAFQGS